MKKIIWIFAGVLLSQSACDLQPKILSFPDSVGDFISARYPALLADPNVNPEIYNSAATDYGVYAAPDLSIYGTHQDDEYVTYASINDYEMPVQISADKGDEIVVAASDDYLSVPMYGGQGGGASVQESKKIADDVLIIKKPVVGTKKSVRVQVQEVVIAPGDTLYSVSRKYAVPVNDLAVMNNLTAPFNLRVGQKLRVPKLASETGEQKQQVVVSNAKTSSDSTKTDVAVTATQPVKKISSDPTKKLPTIGARSSSKFSWPVRGKILSGYGAKNNGLFNDGINIGAKRGTSVNAAENGVVAYAGNEVKGMGNLIIIQHSDGWMTVYAHMDTMNVRRGVRVKVGQQIGTVGETGKVDTPQLHFEVRKGTKAYNPSSYLKK
ncbi:MAG: M23 family metallopeptidase [Alphaproteobacteria bacterium]|nr:M23 family metallopeptidase [Alphaproteobacteria bacterium]